MNFSSVVLPLSSWSVQNAQAQGQREALATFWLAAPTDLLETLWLSPLGSATAELVKTLEDDSQLMPKDIELRNSINERLGQGLQQPLAPQLLLASFLFSPIGRLKIQSPEQNLPAWFVVIYRNLYESNENPIIQSAPTPSISQIPTSVNPPEDLSIFPSTLQELVNNRIQLNRMLGLSNLHYIDPEDQEILEELVELRRAFSNAIQNCPEEAIEGFWGSDLNDRYWAMVRSGIQKQGLASIDEQIKQAAVMKLSPAQGGGFDKPGATNALLVAMLYFEPGTMTVNDPEQNVPAWLIQNFKEIFMQVIPST